MALIGHTGCSGRHVLRRWRNRWTSPPVTTERLERALVLLAYFIELDGDVHLPMYEKFEAELAELKSKEAIKYRARQRLECYLNGGGGSKAIR